LLYAYFSRRVGKVACEHDFKNPIRKGRCWYVCPHCGGDISLIALLIELAERPEIDGEEITD
jgi:hypothetical protein